MTKREALEILSRLRDNYEGTANTTLGDLNVAMEDSRDLTALDKLRDNFANLTWDTSLLEAREIIVYECD